MTGLTLVVDCDKPAMTSNEQRRWHWTKQRNAIKVMQLQIMNALSAHPIATQGDQIGIRVTWYPPNRIRRDHDALNPFRKAAQDALVQAGVIEDDDARFVAWGVTAIGAPDKARPRIEITLVPAAHCWVCNRDTTPPPSGICDQQCHTTNADHELADTFTREEHQ